MLLTKKGKGKSVYMHTYICIFIYMYVYSSSSSRKVITVCLNHKILYYLAMGIIFLDTNMITSKCYMNNHDLQDEFYSLSCKYIADIAKEI